MWIIKYKEGDDVFYRITGSKQPSSKSILFEKPSSPAISVKRVQNALAMIESKFTEEEKEEKKVPGKEAKKMASFVIQNFLKAE